jgi:hypothetical protein
MVAVKSLTNWWRLGNSSVGNQANGVETGLRIGLTGDDPARAEDGKRYGTHWSRGLSYSFVIKSLGLVLPMPFWIPDMMIKKEDFESLIYEFPRAFASIAA